MTQDEFITRFKEESSMYHAWGKFVCQEITAELKNVLSEEHEIATFLKIPVVPRLKSLTSILNKAFCRGKGYKDPYKEINDKIGIRFVVLLTDDISIVGEIVTKSDKWTYSEDRDFQKERLAQPLVFDYQSKHYIVTNTRDLTFDDVLIKEGVECEIQIRTLLQHAYSELTHDTVYKPKTAVEPEVYRIIARSMALIETTDEFFVIAKKKIGDITAYIKRTYDVVLEKYIELFGPDVAEFDEKTNGFILDALKDAVGNIDIDKISPFLEKNSFIKDRIGERRQGDSLYTQPVILLVYYLVQEKPTLLKRDWPLSEERLQLLFTDLGVRYNLTA